MRKQIVAVIRQHRIAIKISQEKLAELMDVHRKTIGKIERGEQNVTINSLIQFCKAFDCKLSDLMAEAGL